MGDFPLMTENGTFIINGAERVVVTQLVRSPGVYFTVEEDPATGRDLFSAKVIPNRGAWLEFETSSRDVISVKVDRKRKIPVDHPAARRRAPEHATTEIEALLLGRRHRRDHRFVADDPGQGPAPTPQEALLEFYSSCARVTRPTSTTPERWSTSSSSTSAATTWAGSAATRSTRGWRPCRSHGHRPAEPSA